MAIKVVDDSNTINPKARYRTECQSCKAVVEYLGYDVSYHRNFPKGYVYCPNCKRPISHVEENRCENDATEEELEESKKEESKKVGIAALAIFFLVMIVIAAAVILALYGVGLLGA